MSIGKRILFISLLLLALVAGMISNPFVLTASAQTPRTISYQGILTSSGTPASGQHLVHIALYDSITSGHLLYEETQQADVVGGVFNITIGSVTPLPASLRFDRPYYFGVSVDGNPELAPRVALSSAPYSLSSHIAELAEGLTPDAHGVVTSINELAGALHITGDSITTITEIGNTISIHAKPGTSGIQSIESPDKTIAITNGTGPKALVGVADNAITTAKLADGSVTPAKIAQAGATPGQILKWNGTAWIVADDNSTTYLAGQGISISGNTISATGGYPAGTVLNSTLRWNGTGWIENPNMTSDASGNTAIKGTTTLGDGVGADNITMNPGSGQITVTGFGQGIVKSSNTGVLSVGQIDLTTDVTGVIPVVHGGTGVSNIPAGQILIGNGVNPITTATLTAGSGISITPSAGTITIANTGTAGWLLIGNSGTTVPTNFLGTTDNQPFEIHVNNGDASNKGSHRVMRYEPNATSANLIGGYQGNAVTIGVVGATIAGGGLNGFVNTVTDDWGFIGGGTNNQAGDNTGSTQSAAYSTVGGGGSNIASAQYSSILGGTGNSASAIGASVGGGNSNQATGSYATVAGGSSNTADSYSAVGGGSSNSAVGGQGVIPGGSSLTLSGAGSFGFNGENGIGQNPMSVSATKVAVFGNTNLWLANTGNAASQLRFYEAQSSHGAFPAAGINYSSFEAGAQSADINYTLPTSQPTSNQVLTATSITGAGPYAVTLGWASASGNAWNLNGNSGTTFGTNFLGTTDNANLQFRTAGVQSGIIQYAATSANTGFGYGVLANTTSGTNNTATGFQALNSNTTGNNNTASGKQALYSVTSASGNTATGSLALYSNTADANTANGSGALTSNTTGTENTAVGFVALQYNATGNNNTSVGAEALRFTTTGSNNTAVGQYTMNANTTGSNNTALGYEALTSLTAGTYNTGIGYLAEAGGTNSTAVGAHAIASGNNSLVLGSINGANSATADVNVGIGTTAPLEKLNVENGNILLSDTVSGIAGKLMFQGTSTGLSGGISSFAAGAQGTTTINYTLPIAQPTTNQVLTATTITGSGPYAVTLGWATASGSTAWNLTGNTGTTAGTNYIGTNDQQAFEIHAYESYGSSLTGTGRVFRFEPNTGTSTGPNLIGGFQGNSVASGVSGATISGGGYSGGSNNAINGNYGTVAGGARNTVTGQYSVISGGWNNKTIGTYSFLGGGDANYAGDASNTYNVLVGGNVDSVSGSESFLGGGQANRLSASFAVLVGGNQNKVAGTWASVVGGLNDTASGQASSVGGGAQDVASGDYSTVAGGHYNTAAGDWSAIPGGFNLKVGHRSFGYNGHSVTTDPQTDVSALTNSAYFGDVNLLLGNVDNTARAMRFYAPNTSFSLTGAKYSGFKAGSQAATIDYTLPTTQPTTNQVLTATAVTGAGPYAVTLGWAAASGNTAWNLTGNSGTTVGTNFLGTTDSVNLQFRANNVQSGLIQVSAYNSGHSTANTGLGYGVLSSNSTGARNTVSGYQALGLNTTGNANTADGSQALYSNTTGSANTALGDLSLYTNTTGNYNAASGQQALYWSTGDDNTANGFIALGYNTTGSYNTASGFQTLSSNTTGSNNSALGYLANVSAGNLTNATVIGSNAVVGASNSLVLGSINGVNSATADVKVGIGTTTPLQKFNVENGNLLLSRSGSNAADTVRMQGTSTGTSSFVAGAQGVTTINYTLPTSQPTANQVLAASAVSGSGPYNVTLGWSHGLVTDSAWGLRGNGGTTPATNFLGTTDNQELQFRVNNVQAGRLGQANTAFGYQSLLNNTSGQYNTFIGSQSGTSNTTGANNTFVGRWSGLASTSGSGNTIVGVDAGLDNTTGDGNTFIGLNAGGDNTSGSYNTALGTDAGVDANGTANTFVGHRAGLSVTSGSQLTLLGAEAQVSNSGAMNASAVGANAYVGESNALVLGSINGVNSATTDVMVGIGTSTPIQKLNLENGNLLLSRTGTSADTLMLQGTSTGRSTLVAGAQGTTTINYTLPTAQPTTNQFLTATAITGTGPYAVTLGWAAPGGNTAWNLTGNSSTTPGTNYLGTVDNQAFEIHVYNSYSGTDQGTGRVLRIDPKVGGSPSGPNITGGYHGNTITNSYGGSIIAGGGMGSYPNTINDNWATIGGGIGNQVDLASGTIAGGAYNYVNATYGTIGGGGLDTVSGPGGPTVAGGMRNIATNSYAFVGGGYSNKANGPYAMIGGGQANIISSGYNSTVAGGLNNTITGDFSSIPGGDSLTLGGRSFGVNTSGSYNASNSITSLSSFTNLAYFGNMDLWLGNTDNSARGIRFYTPSTSTSYATRYYSSFLAGAQSATINYTMPTAQPTTNQVLTATAITGTGPYAVTLGWAHGLVTDSAWGLHGNGGTSPATNFLGTTDAQDFIIKTNSSEAMRLTSGGKIGIGTTTPLQKFNLENGNILLSRTSTNAADSLLFQGTSTGVSSFVAGAQGTTGINYTLPTAQPTTNQVLSATTVTGAGPYNVTLGWAAAGGNTAWNLTGNSGTTAGTNFLGTTDNQAMEILVKNGATVNNSLILNTNGSIQRDAGGNARGTNAIDLQTQRGSASQVSSGNYSTIGGGSFNTNGGASATLAGGNVNTIQVAGAYATIGGGLDNYSNVQGSTIAGGENDTTTGFGASIGGGFVNNASGSYSVIGGGYFNSASSNYAVVSGGWGNRAGSGSNIYSTVGGGASDTASGSYATVGGGHNNVASGTNSVIPGGDSLLIGNNSFGVNVSATGATSLRTDLQGFSNIAYFGNMDMMLGNTDNSARAIRFYAPSTSTTYSTRAYSSFLAGGQSVTINYTLPTVQPSANQVLTATAISGAGPYAVTLGWAIPSGNAWGLAGNANTVDGTNFLGTTDNVPFTIRVNSLRAFRIQPMTIAPSFIAGGADNNIANTASGSFVAAGGYNYAGADYAFNGAGAYDSITSTSAYSAIVGGYHNKVTNQVSGIVAGEDGYITADHAFIGGGYMDTVTSFGGFVGGGSHNVVKANDGAIAGGVGNVAYLNSFIGGGNSNYAGTATNSGAAVIGGWNDTAYAAYSVVFGGQYNVVGTTATNSTIHGGQNNTITQSNSTIAGGAHLRLTGANDFAFHAGTSSTDSAVVSANNTAFFGNVNLWLGNTNNTSSQLRFYEAQNGGVTFPGASTNFSSFAAPASGQTADINYTLPSSQPSANQVLTATAVTGAGPYAVTLGWAAAGGNTAWNIAGNTGTTYGTNFIGTSDGTNLQFRVNNQQAGLIEYSNHFSTGLGYHVLTANTTGSNNTALGYLALQSNTSGSNNTASGYQAGFVNTTGNYGTFIGSSSGPANTTGSSNTFVGGLSGQANTTGNENAFFGAQAGQGATTASANTMVGTSAGYYTTTGGSNSFFGYHAGETNTTGFANVLLGDYAGTSITTGSDDIAIGDHSGFSSGALTNAVAIGFRAYAAQNNSIILGQINGINSGTVDAFVGIGTSTPKQKFSLENGNFFLSRTGANAADTVQFQGTSTGVSSFVAGAQGTTTINYTLPTAQPSTNQVFTATAVTGAGPYAVTLGWAAAGGSGWGLTGNSGTTAGTNYLGTSDPTAFEIHVYDGDAANKGSKRVMRYEPTTQGPNLIGGYQGNTVSGGVTGATISGGGYSGNANYIYSSMATIGGGDSCYIFSNANFSTIGGGRGNRIGNPGFDATIAGGERNSIAGSYSAIPGGSVLTLGNFSFGFNSSGDGQWNRYGADVSNYDSIAYFGNVDLWLGNTGGRRPRQLRFFQYNSGNTYSAATYYSAFQAPSSYSSGSIVYTLPSTPPAATGNLLLATSGAASTWSWSSGLVWDNTNARLGVNTTTPSHPFHSINAATTDEMAAVFGLATGSTANQAIGVWGDANNTGSTNTGTIGVLANGNGNTTAGQTNVALQINDGEFTMGRTTETPGTGTDVEAATGGTAYTAQGPSGIVELTLGATGNLTTSAPTADSVQNLGSVTINNRYCQVGSIVLVNVVGFFDDGVAPDPRDAGFIVNADNTASGSFSVRIKMLPTVTIASNYSTSDKIRIGYMIVNKSK